MAQVMNALTITELGKKAEVIEMPRPQVDESSVVVKTAYSGVSVGTEMWNAYGNLKFYGEPPFINGYQATGTVVEVGENLKGKYREGDYVAVFCSGAHAEYVKSRGDLIHKLSSEKSLKPCSMFVQPSVAMNAWNITGVEAGNTVYVIGQGLIGQCAALLARLKGAYVITSDISEERILISQKLCANWAIDASKSSALEAIQQKYPSGVDIVAESTGFEPLLNDGLGATKFNGKFVFMGFYPGDVKYNYYLAHKKQLRAFFPLFIGERPVQESIIRMIENGYIEMNKLISHEVNWEESAATYNQLFTKERNSFNGIVFNWN